MTQISSKKVVLKTPIGSLSFRASCNFGKLDESQITVHEWEPSIPNGMTVDGCNVILFKCRPKTQINKFVFSCKWVDFNTTGYGNSGEALDAWEWESDETVVVIGTEDSEWLNSRLKIGKVYSSEEYPITMENNTISIRIDEFDKNKELSLHFVVAWNKLPEPKDSSCWFAVDVPHERILEIIK